MGQAEPTDTSSPFGDIRRMVKHKHMQIPALFQVYLGSPPDSRQAIQEQILRQLASHLDREKGSYSGRFGGWGRRAGSLREKPKWKTKKSRLRSLNCNTPKGTTTRHGMSSSRT